jgi:hypothetical protein
MLKHRLLQVVSFLPGLTLIIFHKMEGTYIISSKLKQCLCVRSNYLYATIRVFMTLMYSYISSAKDNINVHVYTDII